MLGRLKEAALMALAVLLVLVGAYTFGSRAAKKSSDLKEERRDKAILEDHLREVSTAIKERKDVEDAVSNPDAGSHVEWLHKHFSRD